MKTVISIFALLFVVFPAVVRAEGKLRIVTTLCAYASIAQAVGGENVAAVCIAPPRFDPHFIEPRPSDVLKLKRADLFIHSGLDLEAWRDPLVNAAARAEVRYGGARELDLSLGIRLLEVPVGQPSRAEGDIHMFGNPHYWLDPRNGVIIARSIGSRLAQIDPQHAAGYNSRTDEFVARLQAGIVRWRDALAPFKGRELVAHHNGWVYLMDFAGLETVDFLEPKPGIPPTPRNLERIMGLIPARGIRGIVRASWDMPEAAATVAGKTGVGVSVLVSNPGELPEVSDYISMFDYNVQELLKVM